jgi:hypothetical protein
MDLLHNVESVYFFYSNPVLCINSKYPKFYPLDLRIYARDCTRCTVISQFITTVFTFQRP